MREGHYVLTEHPETKVGEYVPFYFCPRSIMLYILHKGNHPELDYEGGQRPIVHLQADLEQTIHWAEERKVRWAITDRNAGGYLADFYNHPDDIDKVEWEAVRATDFRGITVKEGKQAEFLIFESFPWTLVEKVGVRNNDVKLEAERVLHDSDHRPQLSIENRWYY